MTRNRSWSSAVFEFYDLIHRGFHTAWHELPGVSASPPTYWKTLGDEVLYFADITDHRQTLTWVGAWHRTVHFARQALKRKWPDLDVKATAWLANFPGVNKEFILDTRNRDSSPLADEVGNLLLLEEYYSGNTGLILDFIGPSIDNGFRLTGLASANKFILSIGLVWMLVETLPESAKSSREWLLGYDGRIHLKGRGPYPVFWLAPMNASTTSRSERRLLSRELRDIKRFCRDIFVELKQGGTSHLLPGPYIDEKGVPDRFRKVPEPHEKHLRSLKKKYCIAWRKRQLQS